MLNLTESLPVKYRPRFLSDIVGNKSNIATIEGQFKRKQITKTWLMCGSPGTGKTTVARIMAMTLNCQDLKGIDPCMECASCKAFLNGSHPDIHEINLAGEQGKVDSIRDILKISSFSAKFNFRVIIADEIQGATPGTKKEILKTLEEPPPGVIWILCTMNPEQLNEAIHGRCLRLFWNYPVPDDLAKFVYKVAKKEFYPLIEFIKPHVRDIVENSSCQPRKSLQVLETIGSALSAKKSLKKESVKEIINDYILNSGELDPQVIRFITYALSKKKLEPLNIISNIEQGRLNEFIDLIFRYSMYASYYIMQRRARQSPNKRNFWGINFIRFESALNSIEGASEMECFKLCAACTSAIEKLRQGILSPHHAIMHMFNEYYL